MAGGSAKSNSIKTVNQADLGLVAGSNVTFPAGTCELQISGRLNILKMGFQLSGNAAAYTPLFYLPDAMVPSGQMYSSMVSSNGVAVNVYKSALDQTKGRSFINRSQISSGMYFGTFVFFK